LDSLEQARNVLVLTELTGHAAAIGFDLEGFGDMSPGIRMHIAERAVVNLYAMGEFCSFRPNDYKKDLDRQVAFNRHDLRIGEGTTDDLDNFDEKQLLEDVLGADKRGIERSISFRAVPRYEGFSDGDSVRLAQFLINAVPAKGDRFSLNSNKLAEDTASIGVGSVNGAVYKMYADEGVAKKEARVMQRITEEPDLEGRTTRISSDVYDSDLTDRLSRAGLSSEQIALVEETRKSGYLSYEGKHILICDDEGNSLTDSGRMVWTPGAKSMFSALSDRLGIAVDELAANPMVQRLYTLALLHGKLTERFSEEDRKIVKDQYADFLLLEVQQRTGELVSQALLDTYLDVSTRQRELFERRQEEGTLVFTHGDAKFDNWLHGTVIADFGSAKFSTEYKDVAKSLLDSNHLLLRGFIEDYIDYLTGCSVDDAAKNLVFMLQHTDLEGTGILRSLPPGQRQVLQAVKEGRYDPKKFMLQYVGGARIRSQEPNTVAVDSYIRMYIRMRELDGNPIQESRGEFRRNVYDAIVTEAVRTIYYKAPMKHKKKLVRRLVTIAEAYADMEAR
jgi:hypothetical protein